MKSSSNNPWLHRFAVLTAVATLFLICVGGVVTSKGVGLAVPDWPTTYGYTMFFFPFSKWFANYGVFYEHSHRLVASGVGFLTTILAVWLCVKEERRWLRWIGVVAFVGVCLQGVLGGLRVTQLKDEIGIFHAALAQLFFVLMCAIALFTSRWWINSPEPTALMAKRQRTAAVQDASRPEFPIVGTARCAVRGHRSAMTLPTGFLGITCLIFVQLVIGATMRHQHAGLAIPDFPSAYGKLWPATDGGSIAHYNRIRLESTGAYPITASGVVLQMVHRILAFTILGAIYFAGVKTLRRFSANSVPARLALLWLALVTIQLGLGAATIWTNKSADIATAHVAVGALSLATGAMLVLTTPRCIPDARPFAERTLARPQPASATV